MPLVEFGPRIRERLPRSLESAPGDSGPRSVGDACNSVCLDDFTRTVADGWGRSSIFCRTWQASSDGTHEADGTVAIKTTVATSTVPTDWLEITEWNGSNLEFLAKLSITAGVASGSHVFDIYQAHDPLVMLAKGPEGEDRYDSAAPFFRWTFGAATTLITSVLGTANGTTAQQGNVDTGLDVTGGVQFWVRCRLEATAIRMRSWLDGSGEPGTWQSEATAGGASFLTGTRSLDDCTLFSLRHSPSSLVPITIEMDSLELVSGVDCRGLTEMPSPLDSGDVAGGDLGGTYPNPSVDFVAFAKWSIE